MVWMRVKSLSESAKLERRVNALKDLIDDLNSGSAALIVEGKNDKAALVRLGIKPEIIFTPNGSAQRAAEQVSGKGFSKAAVLTDFDRTGELNLERIASELDGFSVAADKELRNKFKAILGLRCFQEAATKAIALDMEYRNSRR